VVVVEAVDTPEEAVAAANRTMYGLSSSILSGDTYRPSNSLRRSSSGQCSRLILKRPCYPTAAQDRAD
jgi:acyl-CoA reductase-like NAD-dependent aldehyde dehydrogenase